jgi:hypothetical protein
VVSSEPACWALNLKSLYIKAPDADVLSLTPKEAIVLTALAKTTTHCTYLELIDKLGGETRRTSFV